MLQTRFDTAMADIAQGRLAAMDLISVAEQLSSAGSTGHARDLYARWLAQPAANEHPLAYAASFNLGVLLVSHGNLADAEIAYRNALRIHPRFSSGSVALDELLEAPGQIHAAHSLWRSAQEVAVGMKAAEGNLSEFAQSHLRHLTQRYGPDRGPETLQNDPAATQARRERLDRFDALASGVIFALWLGPAVMSPSRTRALQSIFRDSACPVCFITDATLREWEHPERPLHPAYQYLSEVHRADYLRCYLMHNYGGGYTDIKPVLRPWTMYFSQLQTTGALALGYPEISATAVAQLPGEIGDQLRAHYAELIGYCSMIFRRQSVLTTEWMNETHARLDAILDTLRAHPAQAPMDQRGILMPNGEASQYPLQWTELGGNIFHPAMLRHRQLIIKEPRIVPQLYDYR